MTHGASLIQTPCNGAKQVMLLGPWLENKNDDRKQVDPFHRHPGIPGHREVVLSGHENTAKNLRQNRWTY